MYPFQPNLILGYISCTEYVFFFFTSFSLIAHTHESESNRIEPKTKYNVRRQMNEKENRREKKMKMRRTEPGASETTRHITCEGDTMIYLVCVYFVNFIICSFGFFGVAL